MKIATSWLEVEARISEGHWRILMKPTWRGGLPSNAIQLDKGQK